MPPTPTPSLSLISLIVSVDNVHNVYLITTQPHSLYEAAKVPLKRQTGTEQVLDGLNRGTSVVGKPADRTRKGKGGQTDSGMRESCRKGGATCQVKKFCGNGQQTKRN